MLAEAELSRAQKHEQLEHSRKEHARCNAELTDTRGTLEITHNENKRLKQQLAQVDGKIVEDLQLQLRQKDTELKTATRELMSANDAKTELEQKNVRLESERGPMQLNLEKMDE
jgi:hypothetical protein